MSYLAIVTTLALLQYLWFGFQVGAARGKYGVPAPASSGHEMFDRRFRVQMNTLEQLVLFLPALWMFGSLVSPTWAAALGAVFIIGRFVYAAAYVRDPKSRSVGFALTAFPSLAMLIGVLVWAVRTLLIAPGAA